MIALLLFMPLASAQAQTIPNNFGPDFKENYAEYKSFKFWVTTIGRGRCKVDEIGLQRRLHPMAHDHIQPKFEYWINGQPSGPALHVRVTSSELGSEICAHIIESDIEYYANASANFPNVVANYMSVGPQLRITRDRSEDIDTIVEGIQGQLRFLDERYRAGGYQATN
ncbi:hypothetical protein [Sphingobium sp.]|uniref:hypothetical protein n=1 Tax=Sphingobium sp. TaxID=1912891 RepID=UPI00261EFC2F|nr:hypothetical protein [Sphingobium sp.]